MTDSEEVTELEEIQKLLEIGEVPIGELQRLLDMHRSKQLFDQRTFEDYKNSGVRDQFVLYYADPVDVVEIRQKQGVRPDSIQCVKSGSMEFDVKNFNNELLKRAKRAVTRQCQRGIIQINDPDEPAAKAIIAKVEKILVEQNRYDKPAVFDALLTASTESRFVEDSVIANLKDIGCIALVEVGGETRISYKWQHRLGEYVKRLLEQHDASLTDSCSQPQRDWGASTNRFTAEVKRLIREMNVGEGSGLEKVKPESLMALDRLERMVESRPKTLNSLRNVIRPVTKIIFITPLNLIFGQLTGVTPLLKTVKFPFSQTTTFPFSLTAEKMFVAQEKAATDSDMRVKEAKKFYRKVFGNFHHAKKTEEWVQYRFSTAEMKTKAATELQEWLENRERGVQSNCEMSIPGSNVSEGVLNYKLACLDTAEGLQPLTRSDVYTVLAKLATTDRKLSEEDVVKKLEELDVFKKHTDRIVFRVNRIRKLVDEVNNANKKIVDFVSSSHSRFKFKMILQK